MQCLVNVILYAQYGYSSILESGHFLKFGHYYYGEDKVDLLAMFSDCDN